MERLLDGEAGAVAGWAGAGTADAGPSAHAPTGAPARSLIGALTRAVPSGPIDAHSLGAAIIGAALFAALAATSLALGSAIGPLSAGAGAAAGAGSGADPGIGLGPVWLPNALAVAFLLRVRLANEWPFLAAIVLAGLAASFAAGLGAAAALALAAANLAEVALAAGLSRQPGRVPDLSRLSDCARLGWAAGLVGPLVAALIHAAVLLPDLAAAGAAAAASFAAHSMAMALIVPLALLFTQRREPGAARPTTARHAERAGLIITGMACAVLVFEHSPFSLVFLLLPVTLLHAFRLGSRGTALHVALVGAVAALMTAAGLGPIAAAGGAPGMSAAGQALLLQAFIAANMLIGLPVAAITAGRDRMLARLAAGKREVELLAENITDAVLRFDLAGLCTYASPSVREVLGMAPDECLGQPLAAQLHPAGAAQIAAALGDLIEGRADKQRLTYRRRADRADGTPVFLEADCAPLHDPTTAAREGAVLSVRDVTERVELELLLTTARRHAETAAQAKADFLASMSHEIRTPMNGVLGFAELMLQGELAPDQRRFAELIGQSGRAMMRLLDDVLDLSKLESGQFSIDPVPVDIAETLADCAALHRPAAAGKGLALVVGPAARDPGARDPGARDPAGSPPWIITDPLRLRQIILNLIGNAVKFTDEGEVRVAYRLRAETLEITIADTGIGIAPDRQESIFAPFTQGEADTALRFGGTGLGLSISRQLASLLGGRITVASTPGGGSCFTLALPALLAPPAPLADADALAAPAIPGVRALPGAGPRALPASPLLTPPLLPRPSRILLAEDHDINRILICEMLERCGQEVAIAHDGSEAIAMVIDSLMRGHSYDLVLMDVQMPACDGYAATRAIRAEGIDAAALPIIALTANAFPADAAAARAAGMQAHLAKPVVFADLVRALQRWLPTRIVEETEADADESEVVAGDGAGQSEPGAEAGRGAEAEAAGTVPTAASLRAAPMASAPGRPPHLLRRWQERRSAAIAAVREALLGEQLSASASSAAAGHAALARMLHRLAASAASFGEVELGQQAAALERALGPGGSAEARAALAHAFLALAERHEAAPAHCS